MWDTIEFIPLTFLPIYLKLSTTSCAITTFSEIHMFGTKATCARSIIFFNKETL